MTPDEAKTMTGSAERISRAVCLLPVFWLAVAVAIAPWLFVYANLCINADHAWLAEALRRALSGHAMSEYFFEPNPPWVLLSYLPALALQSWAGLKLHFAIYVVGMACAVLSCAGIHAIVRRWPFMDTATTAVMTAACAAGLTVMTGTMLAERDHFAAMGLVPFVLLQAARTYDLPRPGKITTAWIFALGAAAILLKPFHGLLPGLMIAHRMWRRRMLLAILREPDFIALASVSVFYLAGTALLFPDYYQVILPDAARFYYAASDFAVITRQAAEFGAIAVALILAARIAPLLTPQKNLMTGLCGASLACLAPYILQQHGYSYHLLPAIAFLMPALGLLVHGVLRHETGRANFALFAAAAFIFAGAYAAIWTPGYKITHADYASLKLVKMARDSCAGAVDCSLFMFDMTPEIPQRIIYYAGVKQSSRFLSFWTLPAILQAQALAAQGKPTKISADEAMNDLHRYGEMTAEDLERTHPPLAIIGRFEIISGTGDFDFVGWMSQDPDFRRAWSAYEKVGTITVPYKDYFDMSHYFQGTNLTYDLYRRRP